MAGVQWLVVELCNAIGGTSIPKRWVAAWLLDAFVTSSGADFVQQVPIMVKELIYKLVLDAPDKKPRWVWQWEHRKACLLAC